MVQVEVGGEKYYVLPKLKDKWDKLKDNKLVKLDEDRVYLVDGRERSGKSVFTLQQAAHLDPTIIEGEKLPRICFTAEEFLNAIRTTEPGKVVIFDEAFRGLSSRAALSQTNKKIVQAMMEMGQNNLIVFIVLPVFFMLDIYVAMLRSNALFHVYKEKGGRRRFWKCYNYKKKAKLYQVGVKKGWEYKVHTNFQGDFFNKYPGGADFEQRYRAKKKKSLQSMDVEKEMVKPETKRETKIRLQRDIIIRELVKRGVSQTEISRMLREYNASLDRQAINEIANRNDPKLADVPSTSSK